MFIFVDRPQLSTSIVIHSPLEHQILVSTLGLINLLCLVEEYFCGLFKIPQSLLSRMRNEADVNMFQCQQQAVEETGTEAISRKREGDGENEGHSSRLYP